MNKMNKKGFTLTELVIVIVIIAILAAVLIPSMTGYVNRAKKSNAQSEASSVYTVYAAWLADDATENSYYKVSHEDNYTNAGDAMTYPGYTQCKETDEYSATANYYTKDENGNYIKPEDFDVEHDFTDEDYNGNKILYYILSESGADGINDLTYTCYAKYQEKTDEATIAAEEKASLVLAFAKYYAAAQDITVTSWDAKELSKDNVTGNVNKYYTVGKLSFVAVGSNGFYMLSSNGFGVLVQVSNGAPTYTITDAVVLSLSSDKSGSTESLYTTYAKNLTK